MIQTYALVAVCSYLLGSIPFGYILVKLFYKKDIRETGSGNIGATNVMRSGARGLGIATLLLDAAKGAIPVYVTMVGFIYMLTHAGEEARQEAVLVTTISGLCAILGHMFPVWLKFRGGKGVATALGVFLMLGPKAVLVCLLIFAISLAAFRYVSLGSILSAAVFPGVMSYLYPDFRSVWTMLVIVAISCLIIFKHRDNIQRLIAGTENRLGGKKPGGDAQ